MCGCVCVCVCHSWVFVHEKAYQVRDTAIESSVMTKVKGFGVYNHKVMDVADYVTPTQVGGEDACLTMRRGSCRVRRGRRDDCLEGHQSALGVPCREVPSSASSPKWSPPRTKSKDTVLRSVTSPTSLWRVGVVCFLSRGARRAATLARTHANAHTLDCIKV